MRVHVLLGVLPSVLLFTGCPDLTDSAAPNPLPPLAVGDHLLAADRVTGELVRVAVDGGEIRSVSRQDLVGAPSLTTTLPQDRGALVLSREAERLDRIDADGLRTTYTLGSPFPALSVSPAADAAIAFFPPDTATTVFHNASEIAFIDLRDGVDPEEAVTRRSLASLGGAPTAIVPSPEAVGGRRFAFILSAEHVGILDLSDPSARERSVPLVSLTTGGIRTPRDVTFQADPDDDSLWAIVTTVEGNSVYALNVFASVATEAGEPAFDVRLTQLAGLSSGGEVAATTLPDGRIITVMSSPAQGTLTLTRLATNTSQVLHLSPGVDRVQIYSHEGRPHALVHRSGGTTFHVVDLAAADDAEQKSFRTRNAKRPITRIAPIDGTELFIAFHPGDTDAVSVIDTETDRVTAFGRTGAPSAVIISQALGRLYVLTHLGADDFLVSVDLMTLHPESSLIPGGAEELYVMPAVDTVATWSPRGGGTLVTWPSQATFLDAAVEAVGIFFHDAFERAGQ